MGCMSRRYLSIEFIWSAQNDGGLLERLTYVVKSERHSRSNRLLQLVRPLASIIRR